MISVDQLRYSVLKVDYKNCNMENDDYCHLYIVLFTEFGSCTWCHLRHCISLICFLKY